ncbi:MAG TPA: tRNA (adenosine(37)-N6)-threonylcarbamoyltransferase complex dimerization subunit type 1 TsaB [Solirubrobacteraceae bacterium]|jgi:tRNA threonylcarbamoyladenosine biosynthesis protein TsaB
MIVLGFDTSTPATAIGLRLHDGATVQARDDPAQGERPGHATRLLPLAAGLLAQAGLRFADVERIAVGVGPGTFTGLRIGLASARGLAQALDAELVGVSSLQALALVAANRREAGSMGVVLALIDARRGEAFAAAYAPVEAPAGDREPSPPRELAPPRALAPARFEEILEEAAMAGGNDLPGWVAVGNGATLYRDALHALKIGVPAEDSPLHRVSGEAICALGSVGAAQAIDTVLPDYRRRPDAELALEHATGAGAGA